MWDVTLRFGVAVMMVPSAMALLMATTGMFPVASPRRTVKAPCLHIAGFDPDVFGQARLHRRGTGGGEVGSAVTGCW
jgi:hypothetical protein